MIKYILFLWGVIFFQNDILSQSLQFNYAEVGEVAGDCTSMTNCFNNQVCYFVEYTPAVTGVMTSYTMGFFGNCTNIGSPVISNSTCATTISNSSQVLDGCDTDDGILMVLSGSGGLNVVANQAQIIHQVCFQLGNGYNLDLIKDTNTNLTTNIDSSNEQSYTEVVDFSSQTLNNGVCSCYELTPDSGSPSQVIDCLEPIVPIKYQLNNCTEASVLNLPPGLTAELINGVINIEGTPTNAGAFFTIIQTPSNCECNPTINMLDVDQSIVMISSSCYNNVEDAISEYDNGETIEILGDLISNPLIINNLNIIVKQNVQWTIKNN